MNLNYQELFALPDQTQLHKFHIPKELQPAACKDCPENTQCTLLKDNDDQPIGEGPTGLTKASVYKAILGVVIGDNSIVLPKTEIPGECPISPNQICKMAEPVYARDPENPELLRIAMHIDLSAVGETCQHCVLPGCIFNSGAQKSLSE